MHEWHTFFDLHEILCKSARRICPFLSNVVVEITGNESSVIPLYLGVVGHDGALKLALRGINIFLVTALRRICLRPFHPFVSALCSGWTKALKQLSLSDFCSRKQQSLPRPQPWGTVCVCLRARVRVFGRPRALGEECTCVSTSAL